VELSGEKKVTYLAESLSYIHLKGLGGMEGVFKNLGDVAKI
jgi:hypothetical protein